MNLQLPICMGLQKMKGPVRPFIKYGHDIVFKLNHVFLKELGNTVNAAAAADDKVDAELLV